MVIHPLAPIYDEHSTILILGSFPSVKSRDASFYYAHPQNRFWKVLESVCQDCIGEGNEAKREFLLKHHIALWDVIGCCDIEGSADESIKNVVVNDISCILKKAEVQRVFCNGKKAYQLYQKYLEKSSGIQAILLPSTSPANASFTLEKLVEKWNVIK